MTLPALPPTTDPDKFVEVRFFQCRSCGASGPMVDTSDKNNPQHLWDVEHLDEFKALGQKHDKFYAWTLSRANSRIM